MKWIKFNILVLIILQTFHLKADFISLIRADQCETVIEMYIQEDQIRVTFEIGLMDLMYFREIVPEEYLSAGYTDFNKEEKLWQFFISTFIVKADGEILYGEIVNQEMVSRLYRASLYTGQVDTNQNISKYTLRTEIIYPLSSRPSTVSFTPPIEEGYKATLANIGFVTYHKRIPVNDLRYLGTEETLHLEWTDPWYSKFENKNLKRHHKSALLSFLYVDPYEVRHEVLVRVMDLLEWMDLKYQLNDYIPVEDQKELKTRVAEFLKGHNIVTIDGKVAGPIIDKVHFVTWSLSGLQIKEIAKPEDFSSAVMGIIFVYPHDSIAQNVEINWDMWSDRITEVPNVATDPVGPMPYLLTPDDNVLTWTNYLKKYKLPTVSEVFVRRARIDLIRTTGVILLIIGLFMVFRKIRRKKKISWSGLGVVILGVMIIMTSMGIMYTVGIPFTKKKIIFKTRGILYYQ